MGFKLQVEIGLGGLGGSFVIVGSNNIASQCALHFVGMKLVGGKARLNLVDLRNALGRSKT